MEKMQREAGSENCLKISIDPNDDLLQVHIACYIDKGMDLGAYIQFEEGVRLPHEGLHVGWQIIDVDGAEQLQYDVVKTERITKNPMAYYSIVAHALEELVDWGQTLPIRENRG